MINVIHSDVPKHEGCNPGTKHPMVMYCETQLAALVETVVVDTLSFDILRAVNVARCRRWHPPDSIPWNAADWSNATCGEAGEMANVIKKIRRHETGCVSEGDPTLEELKAMAAAEIADVVIYADLLAEYLGIDLGTAIREKFNKTSVKYGFPERL